METLTPRIKALGTEKAAVAADLSAAQEPDNVVALHPAALTEYRAAIAALSVHLETETPDEGGAFIETIRGLISRVIIKAEPNTKGFEIELRGYLAELCGLEGIEIPDVSAIAAEASPGGNGGSGRGTRTPDPRIMIPVL